MKDHVKTLETENEASKLFIKEQLHVIKKSISDIKNKEMLIENIMKNIQIVMKLYT